MGFFTEEKKKFEGQAFLHHTSKGEMIMDVATALSALHSAATEKGKKVDDETIRNFVSGFGAALITLKMTPELVNEITINGLRMYRMAQNISGYTSKKK